MATLTQYKNKSGAFWEYRFVFKNPITGKPQEKSKKGFKTKAEAKAACEIAERDIKDGYNEENILLKDYIFYWLDSHKKDVIRDTTYDNKMMQIKKHILPFFQNIKLADVGFKFYQSFIDHMAAQGYARMTIENSHWILHSVFNRAIIEKKMKENPAKLATLKGKKPKAEDMKYIPSEQINDLLFFASRDKFIYYIFFKTLLETGMRKGEAAALTWDDIDFKNLEITIEKAMNTAKGNFTDTKNKNSRRIISFPERLIPELKQLRKLQNDNRLIHGSQYEGNLIFCREKGQFLPKTTLHKAFKRIQERAGINAGNDENGNIVYYEIHSLRHSHAVYRLENGTDMKTLQGHLGHGSYEVTANVYSHVSEKMKKKSLDKYIEGTNNLFTINKAAE
jgi:integrase